MSTRAITTPPCRAAAAAPIAAVALLSVFALTGCGTAGIGAATVTEAPGNWASYENRSVRLEGSAANSSAGPFIRLKDGARLQIIGLRVWPIDYATRPVGVEGTIVKGTDAFADRYVLKLDKYYRVKSDQQKVSMDTPEPEMPQIPTKKKKK